jgi:hypothetical protein
MCVLTQLKTDKIRYGYKVVAISKRTGKKWSIAMGFCYDDHERIPNVTEQHGISNYFYNGILEGRDPCFEPNMIGRTALFENISDAVYLHTAMSRYFDPKSDPGIHAVWRIAVMNCAVEEDIMSGRYGERRVIAGRKLTFLGETPMG